MIIWLMKQLNWILMIERSNGALDDVQKFMGGPASFDLLSEI